MTRETFDEQLSRLQGDLLAMGELVGRAIARSITTNIAERVVFLVTGKVEELNP